MLNEKVVFRAAKNISRMVITSDSVGIGNCCTIYF